MKKQGFLYGSAVLIASAVTVKLMGAMFRIPLANMLGGVGMGYFSAAYGIFMPVYAVSVTGLPAAAARAVSGALARGREDEAEAVRRTALRLFGAVGAAGTIIIMIGAYPLCRFISGDIRALPAVLAIAPSVLAGCLISVYRGCAEGRRDMYPTAVSQIIEGLVKLIAGLALCGGCIWLSRAYPYIFLRVTGLQRQGTSAEDGERLRGAALAYGAAAAAAGVTLSSFAGLAYMARVCGGKGGAINRGRTDTGRIRHELLRTAVPAAIGALVINLTSLIDLVTVMRSLKRLTETSPRIFSDLPGAGISYEDIPNFIYGSFTGLAVTLFNLIPSVTNMFGKSMLPAAAAAKAAGDKKRLAECAGNGILVSALVSVPAGLGLSVLAEPALRLLFGGHELEISVCVAPMKVLGLAVPFLCISQTAFSLLQAADRADIPVKLMAIGAVVKLAGNLLLTPLPSVGVTGAAISTLLCYIVIFVLSLIMLTRYTYADPRKLTGVLIRIFCGGISCAAGAFFAFRLTGEGEKTVIPAMISCLTGAAIYIIITYFSSIITKSTLKTLIS